MLGVRARRAADERAGVPDRCRRRVGARVDRAVHGGDRDRDRLRAADGCDAVGSGEREAAVDPGLGRVRRPRERDAVDRGQFVIACRVAVPAVREVTCDRARRCGDRVGAGVAADEVARPTRHGGRRMKRAPESSAAPPGVTLIVNVRVAATDGLRGRRDASVASTQVTWPARSRPRRCWRPCRSCGSAGPRPTASRSSSRSRSRCRHRHRRPSRCRSASGRVGAGVRPEKVAIEPLFWIEAVAVYVPGDVERVVHRRDPDRQRPGRRHAVRDGRGCDRDARVGERGQRLHRLRGAGGDVGCEEAREHMEGLLVRDRRGVVADRDRAADGRRRGVDPPLGVVGGRGRDRRAARSVAVLGAGFDRQRVGLARVADARVAGAVRERRLLARGPAPRRRPRRAGSRPRPCASSSR